MAESKKEEILQYLEKEETACEKLDDLWRDKIDTTGITTVRQFFERYEKEKGHLSLDDLKDLLRDLAYVDVTRKVFPHNSQQNKVTGSLLNASVTADLGATDGNNAVMSGFQPFPTDTMVTGQEYRRPVFGIPELLKENYRLEVKVKQLEQELERVNAINAHHLAAISQLHQQSLATDSDQALQSLTDAAEELKPRRIKELEEELKLLTEQMKSQEQNYQENIDSLKTVIQSLESEQGRVLELEEQLHSERFKHHSTKKELTQERERHLNLQQQIQQERANLQQQYQQERTNLEQQFQQDRENREQHFIQQTQQMQRVAEENCARHQQPEQRSWIIRRSDVSISNNVLGQGSWGIVCQGTFRGSPVAVKQQHPAIESCHNRALFEREMEIASRCRHPNLLQFMGATADDGNPLFITELLDSNLRQLLTERQLNPQEVLSLALDVARGLNYLNHNEPPIMHRDIKSDNILLKRKGNGSWEAKVSDVGAANFVRLVMTPNQGTPLYSAPETATSQYTQKADVYSFGLLLLEMATRQMPAPVHQQISAQIAQICCEPLESIIRDCVHQNPENRPSMDRVIGLLTQLTQ